MENPIRIVIADDHEIFRQGFLTLIRKEKNLKLIGEAKDGEELINLVTETNPDIAFVDIAMPIMDGIAATRIVSERAPLTKVIALSMFNDDNLLLDMLEAGASGYLLKNTTLEEIVMAIDSVMKEENYFCNDTSAKLIRLIGKRKKQLKNIKSNISFSGREKDVLELMCQQLTIKEIANELGLSPRTVQTYREALQEKTGSRNSIGIVLYAIQHGIVTL